MSRELPAWMVDASMCRRMELGAPQLSLAALAELRAVLEALSATRDAARFVSSSNEEAEPACEATPKTISPAIAIRPDGVRDHDSSEPGGASSRNRRTGRSSIGSNGRRSEPGSNGGAQ